jgi:ATP:corrinoid adenosyltransferase
MKNNQPFRGIRSNEVQEILDISLREAQRILRTLRELLGRQKHQLVSVQEFCTYKALDTEQVMAFLNSKR